MVWLSGCVPYQQAEAIMARIGKHSISDSSLGRVTQHYGFSKGLRRNNLYRSNK
jgi:hypothetical protein